MDSVQRLGVTLVPKGTAVTWSKDPGRPWRLVHYFDIWREGKLVQMALINGPYSAVSYAEPNDLTERA